MSLAKTFLAENATRFYCDARAAGAWADAAELGDMIDRQTIQFADGSRLIRDPLACSIVATAA